ncbi:MAG: F0F1 ATP synthase subunit B [Candidatus Kapabacteria bacterium]|jgi:F-type H+-transporting ATPase subunit b|nr:F0F1 ATP synthase subunit B [Candidatus Kapabacteria bacterium]
MPSFLDINPGQIIWTLIIFTIFVVIVAKMGWKPMIEGLKARENAIRDSITAAETASREAQETLREVREKMTKAQQEAMDAVREGRVQAENVIRKAAEEAEAIKQQKLVEAQREIDRSKDEAIKVLRAEVASLVVDATEKLIGKKLDGDDHKRIIEASVNEISKN